jgi:hypothetical protein
MANIASIIFILFILYKLYMTNNNSNMDFIKLVAIIITFSFSFCFTMFVMDKFKFSDNRIIRFIQKLVIYIGISLFLSIVGTVFYSETVYCSSPENGFIANSPSPQAHLGGGEEGIPLLNIINYLIVWNILELGIITLMIFAINYKFIYKVINKIIYYLVNTFIPSKLNIFEKFFEKSESYNSKFIVVYISILTFMLILMILFNIFICSDLSYNIDKYVSVYNLIKKSSV